MAGSSCSIVRSSLTAVCCHEGTRAAATLRAVGDLQNQPWRSDVAVCIETKEQRAVYLAAFDAQSSARAKHLRKVTGSGVSSQTSAAEEMQATLFRVEVAYVGAPCAGGCALLNVRRAYFGMMLPHGVFCAAAASFTPADDASAWRWWHLEMLGQGWAPSGSDARATAELARCDQCYVRGLFEGVQRDYVEALYASSAPGWGRAFEPWGGRMWGEPAPAAGCAGGCREVSAATGLCLRCGVCRAPAAADGARDAGPAAEHAPVAMTLCCFCGALAAVRYACAQAAPPGAAHCAREAAWWVPAAPGAPPPPAGHRACSACAREHGEACSRRCEGCQGCDRSLRQLCGGEAQDALKLQRRDALRLLPSLSLVRRGERRTDVFQFQLMAAPMRANNDALGDCLRDYAAGGGRHRGALLDAAGAVVARRVALRLPEKGNSPVVGLVVVVETDPLAGGGPGVVLKLCNQGRISVSSATFEKNALQEQSALLKGRAGLGAAAGRKEPHKTEPHCALDSYTSVCGLLQRLFALTGHARLTFRTFVDNLHVIMGERNLAGANLRKIEAAVSDSFAFETTMRGEEFVAGQDTLNIKETAASAARGCDPLAAARRGTNIKMSLSALAERQPLAPAADDDDDRRRPHVLQMSLTARLDKAKAVHALRELLHLATAACAPARAAPPAPGATPRDSQRADLVAARARAMREARALVDQFQDAPPPPSDGDGAPPWAAKEEFPTETRDLAEALRRAPGGQVQPHEKKHNQKECRFCSQYITLELQRYGAGKKRPESVERSSYCAACDDRAVGCVHQRPKEQGQPKYFRGVASGRPKSGAADPEQLHMKEGAFRTFVVLLKFFNWLSTKVGPLTTRQEVATIAASAARIEPGQQSDTECQCCTLCYQKVLNAIKVDPAGFIKTAQSAQTYDRVGNHADWLPGLRSNELGLYEADPALPGAAGGRAAAAEGSERVSSRLKRIAKDIQFLTPYITRHQGDEPRVAFITDVGLRPKLTLLWIDWRSDATGYRDFAPREAARLRAGVRADADAVVAALGAVWRQEADREARVSHELEKRAGAAAAPAAPAPPAPPAALGALQHAPRAAEAVAELARWAEGYLERAAARPAAAGLAPLAEVARQGALVGAALCRAAARARRADAYAAGRDRSVVTVEELCAFRIWLACPSRTHKFVEKAELLRKHDTRRRHSNGLLTNPRGRTIEETLHTHFAAKPNQTKNHHFRTQTGVLEVLEACGCGELAAIICAHHPVCKVVLAEEQERWRCSGALPGPDSYFWRAQPRRASWPTCAEDEGMTAVAVAMAVAMGCPNADLEDAFWPPSGRCAFPVQLAAVTGDDRTYQGLPRTQVRALSEAIMRQYLQPRSPLLARTTALTRLIGSYRQNIALLRLQSRLLAEGGPDGAEAVFARLRLAAQTSVAAQERDLDLVMRMWSGQSLLRNSSLHSIEASAVHAARYMLQCLRKVMYWRRLEFVERYAACWRDGPFTPYDGDTTAQCLTLLDGQHDQLHAHAAHRLGAIELPCARPAGCFGALTASVAEQKGLASAELGLAFLKTEPVAPTAGPAAGQAAPARAGKRAAARAAARGARKRVKREPA
jgi:hypothetical protein